MREFRAGRSLPSLILWAFLAVGAVALLWGPAAGGGPAMKRLLCGSAIAALVLLGPAAALLHALRCAGQHVVVHAEEGLLLRGGLAVPWSRLASVRLRPAPFQSTRLFREDEPPPWYTEDGAFLFYLVRTLWAVVYCLLLPAFAVLSPWHGRVDIPLKDGRTLTFRDLNDEAAFVRLVKIGLSGHRDRAARLARACAG